MGRPSKSKKKTHTVETQTEESWVISKEAFCNDLMKEEVLLNLQKKWEERFVQLRSQLDDGESIKQLWDKVNNLADNQTEIQRQLKATEEDRYEDKEILHGADYQVGTVIPDKISELHDSVASKFDDVEEDVEIIKDGLQQTRLNLQSKIDKMNEVAAQQCLNIDAVEQQMKSHNVVIHGISESENQTSKDQVVDLAGNILGVTVKNSDIENAYRFGKSAENSPRKLLIRFRSKTVRDKFYQNRKKTPINPSGQNSIYINEDLTQLRSKLFHDTRKLVKRGILHSTWTQYGNIMLKTTPEDKPVPIFSNEELREKITNLKNLTESELQTDEDMM